MKVTVKYMAQIKQAAGVSSEELKLDPPCSPMDLVRRLAAVHGDALKKMLLDGDQLRPTILLFVNDVQIQTGSQGELKDGDEVSFLSPIAGGCER